MFIQRQHLALAVLCGLVAATGCDFDSELAPRVEMAVVVDDEGVRPFRSDLGYLIELERCRVAIDTVEFTTDGEQHAAADRSIFQSLGDLVIPTAYAHPGHDAGGEVVGELAGRFIFDWRDGGKEIGLATMLEANYSGANFTFTQAAPGDGVPSDDPIIGHTFDIGGVARIDDREFTFEVLLDQDEGRRVIGLPLDLSIDGETDAAVGLALELQDPVEADTLFDGVDFEALDEDGDGHVIIEPGTDAYGLLKRSFQLHDHYGTRVD